MEIPLLNAKSLERQDQGKTRLKNFSLQLRQGEVVGLLGVNGAGKSTALALLSGALAPTRGRVEIAGQDLQSSATARRRIGLLPEKAPLYPQLTVEENLDFAARLRGLQGTSLSRARRAVATQLDLQAFLPRLCSRLSRGMAQRVAIAQALIHQPDILILDEPTAGLDPAQAQALRDIIRDLAPRCTTLLASHILEDMEQLCHRVIILNQGRQVAEHQLQGDQALRIRLGEAPAKDPGFLEALPPVREAHAQGDGWYLLYLAEPAETLVPHLLPWKLQAMIPARQNLQALFMESLE